MAKRKFTAKAVSKDAITHEVKGVLMLGIGVVGGSMLGSIVDKMLKVDHSDTRMDLKKFVRPLVLLGAGTVGSIKLGNETMRTIAKGVAMSGILSGVKVILRKDLLAGLDGFEGMGATDAYGDSLETFGAADVYLEEQPLALSMGIGAESYDPELPALQATPLAATYEDTDGSSYYVPAMSAVEDVEFESVGEII